MITTTARALTLRAGGQYAPLPQLPWLYAFADAAYRRTVRAGRYTGGLCGCLDFSETRTDQGWGGLAGVGATLRLPWHLAIGPELYYEGFRTRGTSVSVDHHSNETFRSSDVNRRTEHTPGVRVVATVAF